jgi:hypothetical protein
MLGYSNAQTKEGRAKESKMSETWIVVTEAPHGENNAIGGVMVDDTEESIAHGKAQLGDRLRTGPTDRWHVVRGTSLWTS